MMWKRIRDFIKDTFNGVFKVVVVAPVSWVYNKVTGFTV